MLEARLMRLLSVLSISLWAVGAGAALTVDYRTEILNPAQNVLDLAVDSEGNVWVVGNVVFAPAFAPTPDALQDTWQGPSDVFVAKLDPAGQMVYGTYVPAVSESAERAGGVAVDADGNVYVMGDTIGGLTTTTPDAFQTEPPGNGDAFLLKLDSDGQLLYATHIGGNSADTARQANDDPAGDVAVDQEGNVFVVGATSSTDFPVLSAVQEQRGGGNHDAFMMKFSPDFVLQWSTYLGNDFDFAKRADTDSAGNLYVLGWGDEGFPTTPGAFQEVAASNRQYFIVRFTSAGQVDYATYLNGVEERTAFPGDIGVDVGGQVSVGGYVFDDSIVTTPGSLQPERPGDSDAFVARLNAAGSDLVFSTYVGGESGDATSGAFAVGPDGSAYIAGRTLSGDFPVTDEIDPLGSSFLTKLSPDGSEIAYSTRLDIERVRALKVDSSGNVYLVAEVGTPGSVVIKISEAAASPCPGDCDGDGTVTISELIQAVNIALGSSAVGQCAAADTNGDGGVSISELIQAVNAALGGCP